MNLMNAELYCRTLSEPDAQEVCTWRYPAPYDVYNCPEWTIVNAQGWAIADPQRRAAEFFAVSASCGNPELLGFFRLQPCRGFTMIGLGLRPDVCGQGFGNALMTLIIRTAQKQCDALPLRLQVRTFNQRAIRCYAQAGFRTMTIFEKDTPSGRGQFQEMEFNHRLESKMESK